jgi:tetratricopeptide (TPR) repeat protein
MNEQERLSDIDRALAEGRVAEAVAESEAELVGGSVDPFLFHLVAWQKARQRDFAGAHDLLARGLATAPDDPNLQLGLATLRRMEGRIDEALAILREMGLMWPENAQIPLEAGFANEFGGAFEAAAADYNRALVLDPDLAAASAGLASVSARLGQIAEARGHAAMALRSDLSNVAARIALARCELDERNPEGALLLFEHLKTHPEVGAEDQIVARGLEGDALAQLGRHDEAFDCYLSAKSLFAKLHMSGGYEAGPRQRHFVEGILAAVEAGPTGTKILAEGASCDPGVRGHAFLIGFPRSGTTLVENILASAEDVVAIEERPTLRSADHAFLSGEGGMAALAAASPSALDQHRRAYWQKAASYAGDLAGKLFVDMDPLKGIKLPLIARLFPDAKIIFMQRDPREVVWSCFKTSFAPTAAAFEFTTLEDAARHYDAVMRLTEAALARHPLAVHRLRYDRLVNDFDGETQALCAFLGITWSPALREFSAAAKRRGVSTASVSQVRKGLYDGTGQWRNYEAQMEAVMPILAPWMARFGFYED